MFIYLLTNEDADMGEMAGCVVIAEGEPHARRLAQAAAEDDDPGTWEAPAWSACEYLGAANATEAARVVLRDFNAAG